MRLIDADALPRYTGFALSADEVAMAVENAPTIDAEPVRHGHWKYTKRNHNSCFGVCSVCKKGTTFFFKNGTAYCPFCGAKMDEEEKDCERCLQVTERPWNDICKACGGRRGQDATRMEDVDLHDLRE